MEKPRASQEQIPVAEMELMNGSEVQHSKAAKALFTASIVVGWYVRTALRIYVALRHAPECTDNVHM